MPEGTRAPYGRDRKRRLSKEELLEQYTRAGGLCQNCGVELGAGWHSSHLAAWTTGGATQPETTRAWCADCNLRLGPVDTEQAEGLSLRLWQQQALGPIMRRLWGAGTATLHAAPGAGKTLFLARIFQILYGLGLVERLIVLVPNLNLVDQTVVAFARIGIFLDGNPRDGVIEHPDTVGLVICYQSLSEKSAEAHAVRMDLQPTLVAFDEVHHLSEKGSWGKAARILVGDVAEGPPDHARVVMNLTGTLFRSNQSQRISSVRYRRVAENSWQAIADWSVPAESLIGVELRPPDLYVYGGQAKLVDLENEKVIEGDIVDLGQRERSAVWTEAYRSKAWLREYITAALRMQRNHLLAVNHEIPLKILFVADGIPHAKLAADIFNEVTGRDYSRLVVSDEPGPLKTLKRATKENEPNAIVAVGMITEGFDCPEVSTIAHATRKAADLFVAQLMARAMRITTHERAANMILPAQLLIPDEPTLREAYARALKSMLHIVVEEEDEERCHLDHRRSRCGCLYPDDPCTCLPWHPPPLFRRYQLLGLDDPVLRGGTVLGHDDGDVLAPEYEYYVNKCNEVMLPATYALRVAVITRQGRPATRKYVAVEPTVTPASPRDVVQMYRAVLKLGAGWMEKHIGHDSRFSTVAAFQAQANDAGTIPQGGRDLATAKQLAVAADWMQSRVQEHCRTHGEPLPAFAKGGPLS